MTKEEALNNLIEVAKNLKKSDDDNIKTLKQFKLALLNLKIQNAHIKENTGIVPIADELNRSIVTMENNVNVLIENNRNKLTESIKTLAEYINENK